MLSDRSSSQSPAILGEILNGARGSPAAMSGVVRSSETSVIPGNTDNNNISLAATAIPLGKDRNNGNKGSPLLDRSTSSPYKSLHSSFGRSDFHALYNQSGLLQGNSSIIQDEDSTHNNSALEAVSTSPLFHGQRSRSEGKLFHPLDKSAAAKLSKRESLKVQKRNYRKEKKRAAKELLHTLKDPSVIVMADWLKIRGTLKSWTKIWCVLKPGLLVLYKSQKQKTSHWVGTILLNTCELIERPSKKDGFCFKLFHPLDQSIWATKGPKGENIGAITQPLPYSYLIFRAPSEPAGKCWMDALELALRCSSLLIRTMTKDVTHDPTGSDHELDIPEDELVSDSSFLTPFNMANRDNMNESDCERHFKGVDEEDLEDTKGSDKDLDKSETETDHSDFDEKDVFPRHSSFIPDPVETPYMENAIEELGQQGEDCQTEEVSDENKSLIWMLVKQVRPGMDLSKVVLPTFILEPRSFLDKLSDYYYHADFLSEAVLEEDAYTRMKLVARWYIAGFYKKPKGLKKPYNSILGETFRCYWKHSKTNSRTFYISEQISHHPPVSAFYVTNRKDGFSASGSILAKSKFYGNSLSAILDGVGRLTFLKRGEDYRISMPYAHCKGILIGTLTMELGGKVTMECEKTGYRADLDFKLKPFLGSGEASNRVVGKIKLGNETLSTIEGHWDQEVYIKEKSTGESKLFWSVTPEVKANRLKRYTVPIEAQGEFESERLWQHVSRAVFDGDQDQATNEKYTLEEAQRQGARERKLKMEDWIPKYFERDLLTGDWVYKYADLRPWDPLNDLVQYEHDHCVSTKTKHRTPIVRTTSITNVDESSGRQKLKLSRHRLKVHARPSKMGSVSHESGSSTPGVETLEHGDYESSDSTEVPAHRSTSRMRDIGAALEPVLQLQRESREKLASLQGQVQCLSRALHNRDDTPLIQTRDLMLIAVTLLFQAVLFWLFK